MTDLTPAAQAVLNAVIAESYQRLSCNALAAAALRAAVITTQQRQYGDGWICDANDLLAIAAELDRWGYPAAQPGKRKPIPNEGTVLALALEHTPICEQPQGEEPTDEELQDMWRSLMKAPNAVLAEPMIAFARAALARWGRPAAPAELSPTTETT